MSGASIAGHWDCHAHLFGPYQHYPLAPERSYTPPEAPLAAYLAVQARLGMSHSVLVHPSAYGDDHSLLLDTLAQQPALRGVVVVRPGSPLAVKGLRAQGVRAARFSCRSGAGTNFFGSASLDDLVALAPALAEEGLHAELWTDCDILPEISHIVRALPVPVMIDHMGGFNVTRGVADAGFQSLLQLLAGGQVWVKLCAYRNLFKQSDWQGGEVFQKAMLDTRADRLVWGSDWPHLNLPQAPDTSLLLDLFSQWTRSAADIEQVLVDNPARLYA